jgi:hypothetical protein
MVKLKISHEVEIVGGVGHDFGAPATGIYEHQLRGLRYAADHFVLPQPWLTPAMKPHMVKP